MEIHLKLKNQTNKVSLPEKLIFGKLFSDHIFEMDYSIAEGWHNPVITEFHNIELSPAAMVFHYGQAIFEGLKAYKHKDGRIALFRPR